MSRESWECWIERERLLRRCRDRDPEFNFRFEIEYERYLDTLVDFKDVFCKFIAKVRVEIRVEFRPIFIVCLTNFRFPGLLWFC